MGWQYMEDVNAGVGYDPSGSKRDVMSGQNSHVRCERGVRPEPGYDNMGTLIFANLIPIFIHI